MRKETIDRVFHTVDQELRQSFPDDYWKRCMYAASATKTLLEKLGKNSIVVSGDFIGFVVSPDSKTASFRGFASAENSAAHLWVECENTLLDIMPFYLPDDNENQNSMCKLAPIAWNQKERLPPAISYIVKTRYAVDFKFRGMPGYQEKITAFSDACVERMAQTRRVKPHFNWVLSDSKILSVMANIRDPWAMSLVKYENMPNPPTKPVF